MYEYIICKLLCIIGFVVLNYLIIPYLIYSKISKMLMDVVELKKAKRYKKIIMCPVCKKSWPYKRPSNFNLKLYIFFVR